MEKRGVIDDRTPPERPGDPANDVKVADDQEARRREDHLKTRLHDAAAAAAKKPQR